MHAPFSQKVKLSITSTLESSTCRVCPWSLVDSLILVCFSSFCVRHLSIKCSNSTFMNVSSVWVKGQQHRMSLHLFTFAFFDYYYYWSGIRQQYTNDKMVLRHNVTAHVVCMFSEQDMLVAVPNSVSWTRFNNNSTDTTNAPREINSLVDTVGTTPFQFDLVGNLVSVLREWRNTTLLLKVRPPSLHITSLTLQTVSHLGFHSAAANGNYLVVRFLIQQGADVTALRRQSSPPPPLQMHS